MKTSPFRISRRRGTTSLSNQGFTLIELLMVIAVILILAGITFGVSRGVYNAQARAKAKGELATISQAIEQYKLQYGDYPWIAAEEGSYPSTSGQVENTMLSYALTGRAKMERQKDGTVIVDHISDNINDTSVQKNPKFIDLNKFTMGGTANAPEAFIDPWGNPYRYFYRKESSPDDWEVFGFHLYSMGPDGLDAESKISSTTGIKQDDYRSNQNNVDNIFSGE